MHIGLRVPAILFALTVAQVAAAGSPVSGVLPLWQQEVDVSQCNPTQDGRGYTLDVLRGTGALIVLDHRLAAYTAQGNLRWQTISCDDPDHGYWERAILTPDGGAWAVEISSADGSRWLRRFDAHGQQRASVDLKMENGSWPDIGLILFGDAAGVVYVATSVHGQRIEWRRFDTENGLLEIRSHQVGQYDRVSFPARALTDGGVGIVQTPPGSGCEILCVLSPYPLLTRLSADGELLWQVDGGFGRYANFDVNGSVSIVGDSGPENVTFLRRVTTVGEVEPDILLPESMGGFGRADGPHGGLLLVWTNLLDSTGTLNVTHWWSVDDQGTLLAQRVPSRYAQFVGNFDAGLLLVESDIPDCAQWLDPRSLETRACFHIDRETQGELLQEGTRLLIDGTLYATFTTTTNDEKTHFVLARYDAPAIVPPGTTAADRRDRAQTGRALLRHYADPGTPRLHDDRAVPGRNRER